jgi:hypothetical protein
MTDLTLSVFARFVGGYLFFARRLRSLGRIKVLMRSRSFLLTRVSLKSNGFSKVLILLCLMTRQVVLRDVSRYALASVMFKSLSFPIPLLLEGHSTFELIVKS